MRERYSALVGKSSVPAAEHPWVVHDAGTLAGDKFLRTKIAIRGLPGALQALKDAPGSNNLRAEQANRRRSDEFSQPHSANPRRDHFGVFAVDEVTAENTSTSMPAHLVSAALRRF